MWVGGISAISPYANGIGSVVMQWGGQQDDCVYFLCIRIVASPYMCNIRQNVSSGEGCFANDAISSHSTPKNVAAGWCGIGHRGECKVTRGIDGWE